MKYYLPIILLVILLSSCATITRTEEDVYTRAIKDTTYESYVHNAPENVDGGVIRPSKKILLNEHSLVLEDSIIERHYPNFIRYGFLEMAGIFGGDSEQGLNAGIFGAHHNPFQLVNDVGDGVDENSRGTKSFVPGAIFRMFFFEKRLRWFQDAPNWTWGFTGFSSIFPDAYIENAIISIPAYHIRWRYYLRERIPYQSVMIGTTIGAFPTAFFNIEAQYEVGSIGGLNTRAYLGYAYGVRSYSKMVPLWKESTSSPSSIYAGLGVSFLDFKNVVPETYEEWKEMEHSAWNIGFMQIGLVSSNNSESALLKETITENINGFDEEVEVPSTGFIKGLSLKLLNTSLALPFYNNRFYAGTSLLNVLILGDKAGGIGILPIRLGYYQPVIRDNLILEPFFRI